MLIHGLQKMTLLDYPEHIACTVFFGGCDLRCPYCHNYELVDGSMPPVMDDEEFFAFLGKRQGLLDGVAITGGEPLLNKDLPDFIRRIRGLGFAVKLDTNGNHPDKLKALLDEGLIDYAAMDIKNSPEKYAQTCGVAQIDMKKIRDSIDLLRNSTIEYEFRTTVVQEFHRADDFEEIGKMIAGAKHYYLQCFTDRDSVPFGGLHAPAREDLEKYAEIARAYVHDTHLRGVD
jgi:pyruvate formate lyase activating enzyme